MYASDVMTTEVVTVRPETEVGEVAATLLDSGISGAPVTDAEGRVLGVVTEGDLIEYLDQEGRRSRSWWLSEIARPSSDFSLDRAGITAADVMTADPVTVTEDTPLHVIASLLESRRIKRVPVVRDDVLVGIVSRSNLLRGFAFPNVDEEEREAEEARDREIRAEISERIGDVTALVLAPVNVLVSRGRVQLWGLADSEDARDEMLAVAENVDGVVSVENHVGVLGRGPGGYGTA